MPSPSASSICPSLPLLESFAHKIKQHQYFDFSKIHLVSVQHLLPTTSSLFHMLTKDFNLIPQNCWLTGKCYSTYPPVAHYLSDSGIRVLANTLPRHYGHYYEEGMLPDIDKLWNDFMANYSLGELVIILDDGGDLIMKMPKALKNAAIGIEQTSNGIVKLIQYQAKYNELPCPVINVARSGAKRLESPLIANTITKQLNGLSLLHEHPLTCGVIGHGFIGNGIIEVLSKMKHKIHIFERDDGRKYLNNGVNYLSRLEELFNQCDVILGCTATDPFFQMNIEQVIDKITHPITLVSCSSADSQFKSFLTYLQTRDNNEVNDVLSDVILKNHPEVRILGGGFPVNFTRTPSCDPSELFAFTRALLLAGLFNGFKLLTSDCKVPNKLIQLSPRLQHHVIEQWLHLTPEARILYPNLDIKAAIAYSEGFYFPIEEANLVN